MNNSIYGKYEEALKYVLEKAQSLLEDYDRAFFENEKRTYIMMEGYHLM